MMIKNYSILKKEASRTLRTNRKVLCKLKEGWLKW